MEVVVNLVKSKMPSIKRTITKALGFSYPTLLILFGFGGMLVCGYYLLGPDRPTSITQSWKTQDIPDDSFRTSEENDLYELNSLYFNASERAQEAKSAPIEKLYDDSERYHREMVVFVGVIIKMDEFVYPQPPEDEDDRSLNPSQNDQPEGQIAEYEFTGLELHGESEDILVVFQGYADYFQTGDHVEITGVLNDQPFGVIASKIAPASVQNPLVEFMENNIFYLTLFTVVWMLLVIYYFLMRVRRVRGRAGLAIAMLLAAILLGGCEIHYTTEIKADGSAIISTSFSETAENVEFLKQVPIAKEMYQSWKLQMQAEGASIDYSRIGEIDIVFFQHTVENLAQRIKGLSSIGDGEQWVFFDHSYQERDKFIRYEGFINTPVLLEVDPTLGSSVVNEMQAEIKKINFEYSLILPGEIVYHNADTAEGNTLGWIIPIEEGKHVIAIARMENEPVGGPPDAALHIYQVLLSVYVLFTILLVVSLVFYRLKR